MNQRYQANGQRVTDQYKNYSRPADRDPREIEYDRQKEDCTFKPATNQRFAP